MGKQMPGIVVSGAGKIGTRHLSVYQSISEGAVVGVVEPDDATFSAASGSRGGELERFITLEEALDHPAVDVIDICTPTPVHFKQAEAALRSGKSVFCEKPLVTSPSEIEALVSLLTGDTSFRVGYPYRYHPRIVRLKQRLDSGALGTPHMALFRIGGRGSHRAWKHRKGSGGGALLDMATHMIDLAYWLFGDFTETEILHSSLLVPERSIGGRIVEVDAEDLVILRLKTQSGVTVCVYADFVSSGFAQSIEVAGSNGSAFATVIDTIPDRYSLVSSAEGLAAGDTVEQGERVDMLALQLADFVASVSRGDVVQDISSSIAVTDVIHSYDSGAI